VPDETARHHALGPGHEFDLVRRLARVWGDRASGLGDDAAVLDVPPGSRLVVSTDSSLEGVHFRRDWLTFEEIGYRAAAAALSDLAAMASEPLGLLVALSLPESVLPDAEALAEGIGRAVAGAGCSVIGGDTARDDRIGLTITVLGHSPRPVTRAGALPGDHVFVTGRLGGPGAALERLARGQEPEPGHRERFAAPVPRIREARWVAARGVTAMIDVSDGLASDAGHLAAAGAVVLRLDLDQLPTVAGVDVLHAARSGEEYELLLTAPAELDTAGFTRAFALPLTRIGEVTAGAPAVICTRRGVRVDPGPGHDHFSR
jgi:thiamine-monophosphate kinase